MACCLMKEIQVFYCGSVDIASVPRVIVKLVAVSGNLWAQSTSRLPF